MFAFPLDYGIQGIWLGSPFGISFVAASYLYLIFTADFKKVSNKISQNIQIQIKSKPLILI